MTGEAANAFKPRARQPMPMRLRAWGILLLLSGILLLAAGAWGLHEARAWQKEGDAACAAGEGPCGTGRTYVLALALALLPFVTLPATILVLVGSVLWALDVSRRPREASAPSAPARGFGLKRP